jgi:SAM-dependent methyltransferase
MADAHQLTRGGAKIGRMATERPNAPATERNRDPILAVLREQFARRSRVLEIGSGTGQHAVHFAAALPHLGWQTSDLQENHAGIRAWIEDSGLANVLPPIVFDMAAPADWPDTHYDAIFTANTLHIASWPDVQSLFAHLPQLLAPEARLVVYGPFNVDGQYTSPSNAEFDQWLKARDPNSGIRDLEAVQALMERARLRHVETVPMPANNLCVVWSRG